MHRACLVGWLVVDDGMDEGWTRADDGVNASNNKSYNFCEMPPESFVTVSYCAVTSDFLAWSTPTHTRTVTGCTQGGVSCKSHGNGIERPRKFIFSRSNLFMDTVLPTFCFQLMIDCFHSLLCCVGCVWTGGAA